MMGHIDIANNIKAVELMKIEILQDVTNLFGEISAEADSDTSRRIAAEAAKLVNMVYLLCNRLGVGQEEVQAAMIQQLQAGIREQHLLERRFGDLSSLLEKLQK